MSTFEVDPAIRRRHALHEFHVSNWPPGLQRASQRERELLALMAHPCYRLAVAIDEEGYERLEVRPSPGQPSPLTNEAREHIRQHRSDLIAWVKRTDADRARLREVGL